MSKARRTCPGGTRSRRYPGPCRRPRQLPSLKSCLGLRKVGGGDVAPRGLPRGRGSTNFGFDAAPARDAPWSMGVGEFVAGEISRGSAAWSACRRRNIMDSHLVEALNRWFAANAFRADLSRAIAVVPLVLIGDLVVIAWSTARSNSPKGRSELLLGIIAAVGALLLNLALGHLYYRARPFLVLDVRPLLPEAVDSSLFSDHLAIAGAAVAALLVARRTFGWIALGLGVLLAIGRVGAGSATGSARSRTTDGSRPPFAPRQRCTRVPRPSHRPSTRRSPSRRSLPGTVAQPTRRSSGT